MNEKTMAQEPKDWVLRKRGVFYRANYSGYTPSILDAGRYTEAEAKDHASKGIHPPVTAHPAAEFMPTPPQTRALIDKSNLAILAVEYGYRACERGESLQAAMSGALRLLATTPAQGTAE